MTSDSVNDKGLGLGLLFGALALGGAALTGINSYNYAIREAQGLETAGLLESSGLAFGLAVVAASLSLLVIHVYKG
jgi:hypothetical protein